MAMTADTMRSGAEENGTDQQVVEEVDLGFNEFPVETVMSNMTLKGRPYVEKTLAQSYSGPAGIGELFTILAAWVAQVFGQYQKWYSDNIGPLFTEVRQAKQNDSYKGRLEAMLNSAHNSARAALLTAFQKALLDRRRKTAEQGTTREEIELVAAPLKAKLKRVKVALAGDENAFIELPDMTWQQALLAGLVMTGLAIGVGVFEATAGGYDMWAYMTSNRTAVGLTLGSIVLPMAFGWFTADSWKVINANRHAIRTYNHINNGARRADGAVVDLIESKEVWVAWFFLAGLLFSVFGLIGYRYWVFTVQDDFAGLMSAIVIGLVALTFAAGKYAKYSKPYTKDQYTRLRMALAELKPHEDKLAALPDLDVEFQQAVEAAKDEYKAAKQTVTDSVIEQVLILNAKREAAIKYGRQYASVISAFRAKFIELGKFLIDCITANNAGGSNLPDDLAEYRDTIDTVLLADGPVMSDIVELEGFVFETDLDSPMLEDRDMDSVLDEARGVLRTPGGFHAIPAIGDLTIAQQ